MLSFEKQFVRAPQPGCDWASQMVLNPALAADPENPEKLHMLFRATGPFPEKRFPGKPLPFPIFLGYAVSENGGRDWRFDFSRPALAPALEYEKEKLFTAGGKINYTNGCIEDPRLFFFEGELFLTVAGRVFPPGPYWEKDDPVQCMPDWALDPASGLGDAVTGNTTVSVLFRVDLAALTRREYEAAFHMVGPLHNPDRSDDRDVFLFPRRLEIGGRRKIVCIHRPKNPERYDASLRLPSIFFAAADSLADFADDEKTEHTLFAAPEFPWEADRIGASWPPVELEPGLWLLPYHGKQDEKTGYTQSFMLLRENGTLRPDILVRPPERLLYADRPWELEGEFATPCLFSCSGVRMPDGRLVMGYGAADKKIGLASVEFDGLVRYLRARMK
ncbi:MAG: hypothetical protein HPZ91_05900 [Lentisphaeria bacterium]|nr:hypothetical protein [Lentisphaeria bacterium]